MAARQEGRGSKRNVGRAGRWLSLGAGGFLVRRALARPAPLRSILFTLFGVDLIRRGFTGSSRVYDALGIDTAERRDPALLPGNTLRFSRSITIYTPIDEVRAFIEEPSNLARVVPGVDSIESRCDKALFVVTVGGREIPFDVRRAGKHSIRFRARTWAFDIQDGRIDLAAAPGERGTEVAIRLAVRPLGGRIGAALAGALGDLPTKAFLGEALYRLRALLDAGEIPVSDDTSARRMPRVASGLLEATRS
ncbi:MAG TPA: YgaP-like transmembrane domain [Planctomycetota bacterium]|nr:YgaP-like transmembrane domain [Planctomycetota bacterium]